MRRGGVALLLLLAACAEPSTAPPLPAEADAASWPTFVLVRGDALRPGAPPASGSAEAQQELDAVLASQRSAASPPDSLLRLHDGDPTSLWTRTAVDLLGFYWTLLPDVRIATPARSARLMALVHVAMHDAAVAVWDAKWRYRRQAPALASPQVRARVPVGELPSYPSEHTAIAAAAHGVLAALALPGDTARLRALLREVGTARIASGAAYPSDVSAGYALGAEVARRVLERAAADGADRPWTGTVPAGPNYWKPTPARRVAIPFDALAGSWRPWVLSTGSVYRPPPHPVPGTPAFQRSMDELRRLATAGGPGARTVQQMDRARYWATEAPTARWDLFVEDELARRRWSVPRSSRTRAWVSIAMYDAFVACWEAKYHYWLARPITIDPTLNTVFSTPPFPSYPSGHSTISTAAARVMAVFFPDHAREYDERAVEASNSRVWAGVHYRFDIEAGDTLGRKVGDAVVARMRQAGIR